MGTMRLIWGYLEKFSLAMWGLNIMDILMIADIDFFKDIDGNLKTLFGIVGFVYLLIQLPFKVMELISNHKFNKLQNQLKEQDLLSKKTHLEDLKEVNKVLENFDQIHKKK
jgi:hypothetical protein